MTLNAKYLLIGYVASLIALLTIGLLVLLANRKAKINGLFFLLIMACVFWLTLFFYADLPTKRTTMLFDTYTFLASTLIPIALFYFSREVITPTQVDLKIKLLLYSFFFLSLTVTVAGLTVEGLDFSKENASQLLLGPGYLVYAVYVFVTIMGCLLYIRKKAHATNLPGAKNQYYMIVAGGIIALLMNLANEIYFVGLRMPYGKYPFIYDYVVSISMIIYASFVGYAVFRHGLFNFKRALAKTFAYFTLLCVLLLIYGLGVTVLLDKLFRVNLHFWQLLISVMAIFIAALLMPYLRFYVNKFTDKLFFRKSYDLKASLDKLTRLVVSSVDLDSIMNDSLHYVVRLFEPEFAFIVAIREEGEAKPATAIFKSINKDKIKALRTGALQLKNVTGEVLEAQNFIGSPIESVFIKWHAELLIRLSTTEGYVGLFVLGPRRSGGFFTKSDKAFLGIASKNLALGIRNALHYAKIKDFATTLQAEVDVATSELKQANRALLRLSKSKDDFISMASHQLLPQLSASRGFVEMIGRNKTKDGELLILTRSSILRMTRLVSDMLNLTRIETGGLVLEKEHFDLVGAVSDEINNLHFAIEKQDVDMNFSSPNKVPVYADKIKICEAIFNLLDNAIQYSHVGGVINVSIQNHKEFVELIIVDEGIGIPEKDKKHLFTNYFRASNAIKKRPSGTGIGLYVTKKILEAHGYSISIESTTGRGTKAAVTMRGASN